MNELSKTTLLEEIDMMQPRHRDYLRFLKILNGTILHNSVYPFISKRYKD